MPYSDDEIRERLNWLIKIRWIACLIVFSVTCLVRNLAKLTFPLLPVCIVIGFVIIYNSWFHFRLRTLSVNLQRNVIQQILLDYIALSGAVYFTGGYNSPFLSTFFFHVGISGIVLPRKWAFKAAGIAVIMAGLVMGSLYLGIVPRISMFEDGSIVHSNLFVMVSYGGIFAGTLLFAAYFITYLSEHLHEKQRDLMRIYDLTEKLRSSIYMEDVMTVLIDSIISLKNISRIKYFSLDKSRFSLVHFEKKEDRSGTAAEVVVPLSSPNVFTETFLSCVACMTDPSTAASAYEKGIFSSLFQHSRKAVLLPVWSSFQKKCSVHFNCAFFDCPAFASQETRCWTIPYTVCNGKKITDMQEKLRECINCELFFPVGLLACDISETSKRESFIDFEFLISILDAASLAISNARLYEKTLELSELDSLTGLKNRRSFFKTLNAEYSRCKRYEKRFSLLMIDIDSFKHYNDLHGHPLGDSLLKTLSTTLLKVLRDTDSIGRYGGEEFIVLLPEIGEDEAAFIAERLRQAVAERNFPHAELQPGGTVTISIGVSCYPDHGETAEKIIKAADASLYVAKKSGKNRVIVTSHVQGMGLDETPWSLAD